jgi:AraC-like DNA-binding protein
MYRFHLHSFGTFDSSHHIGPACWPHFDLFCLNSGEVRLELGGKPPIKLESGDVVLIYPHTPFKGDSCGKEAVASVQHFSLDSPKPAFLPECLADLPKQHNGYEWRRGADTQLLRDIKRAIRLASLEASATTHAIREALHSMILITIRIGLAGFPDGSCTAMGNLKETARWALEQRKGSLSAVDLSTHAGLSPSRFRERFQRDLGTTPREFLKDLRLNEGKRLLRETRRPIKEIAERCGYGDLVAFSRAFKTRFATSPACYRKEASPKG